MSLDLLVLFQQAYKNLEQIPLMTLKDLEAFRVGYGDEVIDGLEQLIEDSPDLNSKIIFTGHRGSGKSTLLAQLKYRLGEEKYFSVLFSIADAIEMSDVNHINILFAIAVRLMEEAEKHEAKIKPELRKEFYQWFATHTRTEIENFGAALQGGFNLFAIIAGKLKADAAIRDEIRQEFLRKVSDLIHTINKIAGTIAKATGKKVLVLIDDLDKLDLAVARDVFQEHVKALFQPDFMIIFTVPISVLRDLSVRATLETEANDQIMRLPVVKLFGKGARASEAESKREPTQMLCEVLYKRIDKRLMEPEIAAKIAIYSGGVMRELIRIANECCRICLRLIRRHPERQDIKIDGEILQEAVKKIRLDFDEGMGKADYAILSNIYKENFPEDTADERFLNLLHGLRALEYRNDELWYDTHPIVTDLLRGKGLL